MKKLFALLLLAGAGFNAFSQEKGSFELGANVGYNLSTATSGTSTNSSYRSGINVTGFGDYFFSDRWSIKLKLAYDQKGWNDGFITNLNNGQSFATNYQINYLTVPVLANWHFGKKRNWYLNFGPYAGILLDASETEFGTDLKPAFNSTDFGLDLGIGVKIPVASKVKILLEVDGQASLTDIIKNHTGDQIKNSRSSYNVGLVFDL